jgi:MFS-type transporter involved in bile tolerance (Atg22 family)
MITNGPQRLLFERLRDSRRANKRVLYLMRCELGAIRVSAVCTIKMSAFDARLERDLRVIALMMLIILIALVGAIVLRHCSPHQVDMWWICICAFIGERAAEARVVLLKSI